MPLACLTPLGLPLGPEPLASLEVMRGTIWEKIGQGGPAVLDYHLDTNDLFTFTFDLF